MGPSFDRGDAGGKSEASRAAPAEEEDGAERIDGNVETAHWAYGRGRVRESIQFQAREINEAVHCVCVFKHYHMPIASAVTYCHNARLSQTMRAYECIRLYVRYEIWMHSMIDLYAQGPLSYSVQDSKTIRRGCTRSLMVSSPWF